MSDSAMLTRPQREMIAQKLEEFRENYLAEMDASACETWVADVEERLDLRLRQQHTATATRDEARAALISLFQFLSQVAAVPTDDAIQTTGRSDLMHHLNVEERPEFLKHLPDSLTAGFAPPALDPSSDLTQQYLQDLYRSIVRHRCCHEEVRQLLQDVVFYFRQTASDAEVWFRSACESEFGCPLLKLLNADQLVAALPWVPTGGQVTTVFKDIQQDSSEVDTGDWRLVLTSQSSGDIAFLLNGKKVVWTSSTSTRWQRRKGYIVDQCVLTGGDWIDGSGAIQLEGSLIGGGFRKYFEAVLSAFPNA